MILYFIIFIIYINFMYYVTSKVYSKVEIVLVFQWI